VAGHPAGRRPVPSSVVLRTAGHHRALPGHDEHGTVTEVVGRGEVPQRDANHLAGGPRKRDRRGWLRNHGRSADRVAGQGRRSHGTGRPASLGPGPDQPIHDWQTVLTKQRIRLVHDNNNILIFYVVLCSHNNYCYAFNRRG